MEPIHSQDDSIYNRKRKPRLLFLGLLHRSHVVPIDRFCVQNLKCRIAEFADKLGGPALPGMINTSRLMYQLRQMTTFEDPVKAESIDAPISRAAAQDQETMKMDEHLNNESGTSAITPTQIQSLVDPGRNHNLTTSSGQHDQYGCPFNAKEVDYSRYDDRARTSTSSKKDQFQSPMRTTQHSTLPRIP